MPLSHRKATLLAAELRAVGFEVSEVTVGSFFAASGLLESMWLRHSFAGGGSQR